MIWGHKDDQGDHRGDWGAIKVIKGPQKPSGEHEDDWGGMDIEMIRGPQR